MEKNCTSIIHATEKGIRVIEDATLAGCSEVEFYRFVLNAFQDQRKLEERKRRKLD
jgi:hypothetical protein